ncbi:MAG: dihydrodipicolinate synthase family protein [Proteobacteria bacterium]|nr:dihydrodipicolinate synthase family protein [Pseudomonadota bacterium]
MHADRVRGLWVATLTPIDGAGQIDAARLAQHCRALLMAGCDGVTLFGTTGEGQSFSVAERIAALDAVLAAGIAPERVVVGTGATALPDAVELTRHAVRCDVAATLLLPPFYFKDVADAGVVAAVGNVVEAAGDPGVRIFLYHIPSMSAVPISPAAAAELRRRYGPAIAGIKDSSLDWATFARFRAHLPDLAILVGDETLLVRALNEGGAGTICGLSNVAPALIRALCDRRGAAETAKSQREIERLVKLFAGRPFVATLKTIMAEISGDPTWLAVRAPLVAASEAERRAIVEAWRGLSRVAA